MILFFFIFSSSSTKANKGERKESKDCKAYNWIKTAEA